MIKRFPSSRNQRSKGVKIKHVLQVILLLGVCFWLIYQVKHNHDKKKEFDKNDSTLSSVRTETDKVLKLGRKDLLPVKDEVDQNGKHDEEDDEPVVEDAENKHEHGEEQQEEGKKHETEESEDNMREGKEEQDEEENKGENKTDEIEDEGGDVETDENDHEKSDVDNDQDDEDADELKDKVEDSDEMEDEEKEGSVENHGNHEAREEHYKGDDASSAVAHDTHATSTEAETINLTEAGLSVQMNIEQPDNVTSSHSDENNRNQNDSDLKDREGEVADAISSNMTGNNSLSTETAKTNTDSHLDVRSNLTAVVTEASNNSTGAGDDTANSSEQIKTVIVSESDNAQNATANTTVAGDIKQTDGLEQSGNKTSEENLPDNDATVSVKLDNRDAAPQESPTLGASALEKPIEAVASNETENISGNLDENVTSDTTDSDKSRGSTNTSEANETQNINTTGDEIFKGNTQTGETDEKSDSSSANEILDSVIHDAIDLSDTQNVHEDMATARTDLDTLPDIQNVGNDGDENSAE